MTIPHLRGLSPEEFDLIVPENTLLLGYVGSLAHGTYIPSNDPDSIDDVDIMGVCFADLKNYFGFGNFEQREKKYKEWDSVVYEIRKLFGLLLKGNPNVMGLLYLRPQDYILKTEMGMRLIENRNIFVSKQSYHSFVGYAHAQLHKMEHFTLEHQQAFDALEAVMLVRFGEIPEDTGQHGWDTNKRPVPDVFKFPDLSDNDLKGLHHYYEHKFLGGYMGKKRKALVRKYGWDLKNGAHLVRLLRMLVEFLVEGELNVFRKNDAQELMAIKRGEWTLEQVKSEADRLFVLAQEAYVRSGLPNKPNAEMAEELLLSFLVENFNKEFFSREGYYAGTAVPTI